MSARAPAALAALLILAACSSEPAPLVNAAMIENLATPPPTPTDPAEEQANRIRELGIEASEIPGAFRGEWIRDLADCRTGATETRLIVGARSLRFHESAGEIASVRIRDPREIVVRVTLTGEGETRIEEKVLQLSPHLEALTIDGFSRRKCRGNG